MYLFRARKWFKTDKEWRAWAKRQEFLGGKWRRD